MTTTHPSAPPVPAAQRGGRCWFVSRHVGAIEWAQSKALPVDICVHHLDLARVRANDVVIGMLPVHMAAAVCAKGARYYHLAIDVAAADRGRELSPVELDAAGARLVPIFLSSGH
jgi:CRISPR-associated protein Csx16